ncbi:lysozyme C, milk isozyme [Pogona vitticeps]
MKALYLALSCLLTVANEGRLFYSCELYYKLRHLGLDGYQSIDVKQYVCLAQYPAAYDTQYYVNEYGTPYYGLFHLSGLEWCDNGRHISQNKCNISCDLFLDDDISDDVQCLKKAIRERGINHWNHYKKNCHLQILNLISLTCTYWFHEQPWYKDLIYGKKGKNPMGVHIHFPKD